MMHVTYFLDSKLKPKRPQLDAAFDVMCCGWAVLQ